MEELSVPDNVRFVRHINHCYDWWGLGSYFELLNKLQTISVSYC